MSTKIAGRTKQREFFVGLGMFGFGIELIDSMVEGATVVLFGSEAVDCSSQNGVDEDSIEEREPRLRHFHGLGGRKKKSFFRVSNVVALDAVCAFDLLAFSRLDVDIGTHAHAFAQSAKCTVDNRAGMARNRKKANSFMVTVMLIFDRFQGKVPSFDCCCDDYSLVRMGNNDQTIIIIIS